jgi:16S rRNA (cytosine967-C5)-methyltransferase
MRVPEWAAVDEAVTIEKEMGGKHGLVNAVLRNFLRTKPTAPDPRGDASGRALAIVTSHPLWLVQRWIARFGLDAAIDLCTANNAIPQTALRIGDAGRCEEAAQQLVAKNIPAHVSSVVPSGIELEGTVRFRDLAEALSLPYVVQDEAAQLVGYLVNPAAGQRVLDACAAPGGKATHCAELMGDEGEVVAIDLDDSRLDLLRETCSRLGLKSIAAQVANALTFKDERMYDHVLVDAPCSALGTIRRNPDIKYRVTRPDLERLQITQQRMLANLAKLVRPGGTLVYAVCSTEPEEGEVVIRRFLQEHPDFSMIEGDFPFFAPFACREADVFAGYRTFPHRHGMDGFFAARMKRSS